MMRRLHTYSCARDKNLSSGLQFSDNRPWYAQAKGLINGFAAASLMFAPGAMVPAGYAEDLSATAPAADDTTEAPKPKKKKKVRSSITPTVSFPLFLRPLLILYILLPVKH